VSEAFMAALEDALNTRELLKVKVLEAAPLDARAAADRISQERPELHIAQVIGRTIVVYRPAPENPRITLPD
jgi:RNA-binding protein